MRIKNFLLAVVISLVGLSCEDVFEVDLSQESVELLSPADSLVTELSSHSFWWEQLSGASSYTLEIVRGTFNQAESLVLDTTMAENSFDYMLSPGDYQWRVRAENSAYQTGYTTNSLFIDSTINISGVQIEIMSPVPAYASSVLTIEFSWQELYNADGYHWELRDENMNLIDSKSELTQANTTYEFSQDGFYFWQVKAFNNTSNTYTQFSTAELYIDTNAPELAQLLSPSDGDSLVDSELVVFEWESDQAQTGESMVTDYLYIDSDSSFTQSPIVIGQDLEQYSHSLEQGSYLWKVERVDAAGNTTSTQQINQFFVAGE